MSSMNGRRRRYRSRLLGLFAATVLLASACGQEDAPEAGSTNESEQEREQTGDSSAGVPPDSDPSAYAEALEDEEPTQLRWGGLLGGPDHPAYGPMQDYADSLEERSGGALTFDMDYGTARVPLAESAPAMTDGRQDLGLHVPEIEPERWPIFSAVSQTLFLSPTDPVVGRLVSMAALVEFGQTFEALQAEFEGNGLFGMYPMLSVVPESRMYCAVDNPLQAPEDFQGLQVGTSAGATASALEELGATPVNIATLEVFEGLERGVIDCSVNPPGTTITVQGLGEPSELFAYGDERDLPDVTAAFSFSAETWEDLPLPAQQLIWDTQPELLEIVFRGGIEASADAMQAFHDGNAEFVQYGQEVEDALAAMQNAALEDLPGELEELGVEDAEDAVDDYQALIDKWERIVTEDLGIEPVAWEDLPAAVAGGLEIDFQAYVDALYEEILLERRPS